MKIAKNKTLAIAIALLLAFSMTASMMLIPSANAHSPPWNIPTYAYIVAEPNPIGLGQTIQVYMWLDEVYGAAGGTTAAVGTNGYTASSALLSNDYRFHNYELTITAPDGTKTTRTFPVISDPTSNQETSFTATATGTYTFNFTYLGQAYGANGDGWSGSILIGDTYLPSSASTTLTVQQAPIPAPIGSSPLPTAFWESPVYGENTIWYTITSNWLGSGLAPDQGYEGGSFGTLYRGTDAIGPLTSHIMWTSQLDFGGVVGGNMYTTGGSDPNVPTGVQYWEGSSYQPRFTNPIILDGYLYYTEPISFSGGDNGPTVCVNLMTGQQLWSSINVPPLSFAYVYNLWDPDQHGVYPPILVASNPANGNWNLYDAYTGDSLFNVTNIPSSTSFIIPVSTTTVAFANQVVSTNIMGPSGEALRFVISNDGTATNPNWYLSEWNMSKLWQYDINPYTGGGSTSPAVVNASNGVLIGGAVVGTGPGSLPPPVTGILTATKPNGLSALVPYDSSITVNANIPINDKADLPGTTTPIESINYGSLTTYDWNVSIPWLNAMPPPPDAVNPVTGVLVAPPAGSNPVSIVAVKYGDLMLCREGSLPTGYATTGKGYPQLPYTYFAVNLNSSVGAIGSILWKQTYNPPAGNITLIQEPVDFQTGVWTLSYEETMQFVGYSLTTGNLLWGPTPSQTAWDYYGYPGTSQLPATIAYGNLYDSSFGGICYCYSDTTGKVLWTYGNGPPGSDNSTNAGLNVFYGDYPTMIQSIANGVIYMATNEHTIPNPIYKGAVTSAINATTGQLIWRLSDYPSEWSTPGSAYVVADGYATFMNGYNNQIYSVGRGPSKTSAKVEPFGNSVVISGTVTDISAGTTESQQAADFPNGVPCASDASMQAWMGYVYQQQPEPTNFTGVPVTISVTDSNHNTYVIGTATTDESGMYTLTWTPIIPGNFTVYANFQGTNGYWPSSAETSFYASPAAATPAPTASPPTGLASTGTLELGVAAIIIVIVIIGAVLAVLTLRKRP
jgi:hypothetical protein